MFLPATGLPMPRSDLSGKRKMLGKQLAGKRTQGLIRFWQAQVTSKSDDETRDESSTEGFS